MKSFKEVFPIALLCILFFKTSMYVAQNPSQIDVLTTEQGLPFRDIKSITQDTNGLMWFGTSQGIMRYDGYHFKNYNSDKKNPFYIEEDQITGEFVLDNSKGELWFMANDKLFALEITTDSIKAFTSKENIKGDVLRLLKTSDGTLWIITDDYWTTQNGGSKQYLQKFVNGKFEVVASSPRINRGFSSLKQDFQENIWWSTTNGTYKYGQQGNLLGSFTLETYDWFDTEMSFIRSFFDSGNTHYYFPHQGGINIFEEANESFKRVLDNDKEIFSAIEDYQHHLWFSGDQVLYRMDPEGNFVDYTQQLKQRLDYSKINQLFIDNNNLLWVATDNGLFKIRLGEQVFDTVFKSSKEGWGNTMRGFFEDARGTIYALCENQNKIFYKTEAGVVDTLQLTPDVYNYSELQYAANFFVLDDTKENVFTAAISLLKINLKTGNVTSFDQFKHNLKVYGTNPFLKLRDGRLLFGYTFSRLTLFDPSTEISQPVFKASDSIPEITDMRFFKESINDNIVWIGTQNDGLYKVSMNGTILQTYKVNTKPGITKNFILVLEENKDGSLWVGTYGGGLNLISADGETIKSYTKAQGLPDNNIVGILTDEKKNLWISTYNGLSYFDIENQSFQNFYTEDGLSHNEFNYSSFFKDSQGRYYFGGMNGVTLFEPGKVLSSTEAPALELLSFSGYNNKHKNSFEVDLSQSATEVLDVSPYDQYFQVSWTMPSYFNSQKNTYSTTLEGYEDRWFFQGSTASIRYNQLPAGDYLLKIKGTDSRGNASAAILSVPIHVRQIFYKQWWFIGLIILAAVSIVYTIFRYRLQQVLAMERLRTKISSDLHDEVGSLLSGLAMQTELLEMNATEADKFRLQKIASISRNAVSQMRDLVWSIDSRRETVNDLIERMRELAEELLLPKDISFEINSTNVQNPNKKLPAQVKQSIFLIYKEAITNILRHSDATHVSISLGNFSKGCRLSIKDNGSPKVSYKSTGIGLANMVLRAKKIKGEISFTKENGFAVLLDVPFHL